MPDPLPQLSDEARRLLLRLDGGKAQLVQCYRDGAPGYELVEPVDPTELIAARLIDSISWPRQGHRTPIGLTEKGKLAAARLRQD
jgi:hypothetical protein